MKKLTLKQWQPLLKWSQKTSRPILSNACVKDNNLFLTDVETWLKVYNVELSNGLHDVHTLHLQDRPIDKDVSEYPSFIFDYSASKDSFSVTCEELERLMLFVCKDETRMHLNGIAWHENKLVACDGHRLRLVDIKQSHDEGSYILPSSGLKILIRLLKKHKVAGKVQIIIDGDYFYCELPGLFCLGSRLVLREYPKYQAIIPQKTTKSFEITKGINFKELKPLLNERSFGVRLKAVEGKLFLNIDTHQYSKQIGHSHSGDFEIGINARYLTDALNSTQGRIFKFNNDISPMLINGGNDLTVIMPLKL